MEPLAHMNINRTGTISTDHVTFATFHLRLLRHSHGGTSLLFPMPRFASLALAS